MPVPSIWSGTSFYKALAEGDSVTPNYVGVLCLVWSYVLSARLLEMQRHKRARLVYMDSAASLYDPHGIRCPHSVLCVNIGNVDACAARWWMAILAPRQG